jgi:hypothetical protein
MLINVFDIVPNLKNGIRCDNFSLIAGNVESKPTFLRRARTTSTGPAG